jgi:response regulator NasT
MLYYITQIPSAGCFLMESILLLSSLPVPEAESILQQTGYKTYTLELDEEVKEWEAIVRALIFRVNSAQLHGWLERKKISSVPMFWWTDSPIDASAIPAAISGLLYDGMDSAQIRAHLVLGSMLYMQRRELREERDDLLEKLHERKWIEQAKAILSEIQGLSEAEAYHFLRKEAMKERKKMMDIAQSIVKAYQIIKKS